MVGKRVGAALGVLAATVVVVVLANLLLVPRPDIPQITDEDARKVARVNTILSGMRSAITVAAVVMGVFIAMGVSGVDTKAMLLSAGVVGLVIGFGAQSIIRSFLAGLVMLTANRLNLGDLVRLDISGVMGGTENPLAMGGSIGMGAGGGWVSDQRPAGAVFGIVRDFTLMSTTVEDIRGAKTYVSNSNIALVTNYSQNPQRATVLVHVNHGLDPVAVRAGLEAFVQALALEQPLKDKVITPPMVKGITAAGEKAYVVAVTAMAAPKSTLWVERYIRERLLSHLHATGIYSAGSLQSTNS